MPTMTARTVGATLGALLLLGLGLGSARAELAPQYAAWDELNAIMDASEIPDRIGAVTKIEWIGSSRYRITADRCHLTATVRYDRPEPRGDAVELATGITGVTLSEAVCE